MPKLVEKYACNHCSREFDYEAQAANCEHTHYLADKVISAVYQESQSIPRSINIDFKRVSAGGATEIMTLKFYEEEYAKDNGMGYAMKS